MAALTTRLSSSSRVKILGNRIMTLQPINNGLDAVNNRLKKLRAREEPMTSRQNCVLSLRSRREPFRASSCWSFDKHLNTTNHYVNANRILITFAELYPLTLLSLLTTCVACATITLQYDSWM